ncbi:membrane bound O-acyl transferase family-domain-containing protein [Dichotomocladium elegans]|nr:membrane bound O-acyl transferase family-domain-containing protein [Dichotomocladium elegans]
MNDRLGLLLICIFPSLVFYTLTKDTKVDNRHTSEVILYVVVIFQLALPLAVGGRGEMLDHALAAIFSCFASFGMVRFIADRRCVRDGNVVPFYSMFSRWNVRDSRRRVDKQQQQQQQKRTRKEMQGLIAKWLTRGLFLVGLSVPTMAFFDGFLRVCLEPLQIPYMTLLLSTPPYAIPLRTLVYYSVAGLAFLMHVVVMPSFALLVVSLELVVRLICCPATLETRFYSVQEFVQRPPLFNKPWLATSIRELWSKRWHQMLRWAFRDIIYMPIRRALHCYPELGRAVGVMAVFLVSGFLHEYILMSMFGFQEYLRQPGIAGFQTLFFVLQGLASIISEKHPLRVPTWLARFLTWSFIIYTAPLFIEPFLRIGLHRDAEIPGYPRFLDKYLGQTVCPYGGRPDVNTLH